MPKVLVVSDDPVPSGFGRISCEVSTRLVKRGYNIMAAGLQYDGLLPPTFDGVTLPYWVSALAGKNWPEVVMNLMGVYQPDAVLVIQDAPYGETVRNLPVDWSQMAFVMVTPVDGVPIHPNWVKVMGKADAALTISRFGVEAYRQAGVTAELCQPGIDPNTFYRLPDAERQAIRTRLGIAPDAFVLMCAAMNQGRKAIPPMLKGFFDFSKDKPNARFLLDMDAVSPAGWDIPAVCQQQGWDAGKLIFRADAARLGVTQLRDRFNAADAHTVLAHREGWGLPLVESMACGVPTIALDYCSGTEIVGEERGYLVKCIEYREIGTWGGAEDAFPDLTDFVSHLQRIHDHPDEARAIAQRGMEWARRQSWDAAADAVQNAIERALSKRAKRETTPPSVLSLQQPATPPDGVVTDVQLMEAAKAG